MAVQRYFGNNVIIGTKANIDLGIGEFYPQVIKSVRNASFFTRSFSVSLEPTEKNGDNSEANAEPQVSRLHSHQQRIVK